MCHAILTYMVTRVLTKPSLNYLKYPAFAQWRKQAERSLHMKCCLKFILHLMGNHIPSHDTEKWFFVRCLSMAVNWAMWLFADRNGLGFRCRLESVQSRFREYDTFGRTTCTHLLHYLMECHKNYNYFGNCKHGTNSGIN